MIVNKLTKELSFGTANNVSNMIDETKDNMNCVKIAIVEEYYPEQRTAKVNLVNKIYNGVTDEGIQKTKNYPPLYPRVMFIGTKDNGIDYDLKAGDEVLLFFCDKELESWWLTGEVCQLNSFRSHHMSDCVALAGIRSMPKTTPTNSDLNIYSNGKGVNISANNITIKADSGVTIDTPNVNTTGNLNVGTGVSAVVPCGAVTLTFSNGILVGVS